jgi:sulfonate transport system substrate-binding protein
MHLFSKPLIAVLAFLAMFGVQVSAHADDTLRIGYLRTQGYIPDFPLAKVAIPGVTLQLIPLESGNDVLEALNANAIDIGETGEVQPIFAQSGNHPVRVIAATAPQTAATAILVAKDSPIHTIVDLRGKKVSFTPGTNTHWLLIQTLSTVGLKQSDVQPVLLNSADAVSALAQGQLDAAIITAPTIQIAQSRGARVLADGKGLVNSSIYYLANTPVIAGPKRPELDAFVRSLNEHLVWIQGHLNERAAYLGPKYGVPPALVLAASKVMVDHLAPVGDPALATYTQRIADAFYAQKLIPAHIDVRQEFDGSFDKNLAK